MFSGLYFNDFVRADYKHLSSIFGLYNGGCLGEEILSPTV